MATDTVAVLVAAGTGYLAWASLVLHQSPQVYIELWPLIFLFSLAYATWGLYPGFGLGAVELVRRMSLASALIFLSLAAINYALKISPPVLAHIVHVVTPFHPDSWYHSAASSCSHWRSAGAGGESGASSWGPGRWPKERCDRYAHLYPSAFAQWWLLLSVEDIDKAEVEGIPIVLGVESVTLVATAGVRVALIADEHGLERGAMVDKLQQYFRQVILLRGDLDIPVERVEVRNLGGVFGLEFVNQLLRRRNRAVKRSMDIGLGSILLLASLPYDCGVRPAWSSCPAAVRPSTRSREKDSPVV